MEDVTLAHAKEHLEELIEKAARGESVRIADPKHGTMRLVPALESVAAPTVYPERIPGRWKDRLAEIPEERLLAPLTDEELAWLSGELSPIEPSESR